MKLSTCIDMIAYFINNFRRSYQHRKAHNGIFYDWSFDVLVKLAFLFFPNANFVNDLFSKGTRGNE